MNSTKSLKNLWVLSLKFLRSYRISSAHEGPAMNPLFLSRLALILSSIILALHSHLAYSSCLLAFHSNLHLLSSFCSLDGCNVSSLHFCLFTVNCIHLDTSLYSFSLHIFTVFLLIPPMHFSIGQSLLASWYSLYVSPLCHSSVPFSPFPLNPSQRVIITPYIT